MKGTRSSPASASLGFPGSPIGDLWRAADLVREHRGDSHTCAWVSHGVDAVEITLLTELWWRLPLNSYMRTRGWTEEHIDTAIDRLRERGLIEGDGFTPAGQDLRSSIEEATDRQERAIVEAIGDDADELFALLEPWPKAIDRRRAATPPTRAASPGRDAGRHRGLAGVAPVDRAGLLAQTAPTGSGAGSGNTGGRCAGTPRACSSPLPNSRPKPLTGFEVATHQPGRGRDERVERVVVERGAAASTG